MCSSGSLSILGLFPSSTEYKVSAMPVSVLHTHMWVRVFTCTMNVHGSVLDSVYMCAYVCMCFLVVVCKDAGMCNVLICVSVSGCT